MGIGRVSSSGVDRFELSACRLVRVRELRVTDSLSRLGGGSTEAVTFAIDRPLKYAFSAACHSLSCSASNIVTSRRVEAPLGRCRLHSLQRVCRVDLPPALRREGVVSRLLEQLGADPALLVGDHGDVLELPPGVLLGGLHEDREKNLPGAEPGRAGSAFTQRAETPP